MLRTLDQILYEGIREQDWTYCKKEYAPHEGCKIGMPEHYTPDDATRDEVDVCYIVTSRFRTGNTTTNTDLMYLSDGRFYWYDNLWNDDEIVDQEKTDEWFFEPIAWIPYKNLPNVDIYLPIAPHNVDAVPTPHEQRGLRDDY